MRVCILGLIVGQIGIFLFFNIFFLTYFYSDFLYRGTMKQDSIAIKVEGVSKVYGKGESAFLALNNATLNILDNEFFTLLGPSGCGKTTLLRIIAGFENPTQGSILLHGEDISHLPPNLRSVNTVFQSYALFPHMTVAENISFGLEMLNKPKQEIKKTVSKMLSLVHMEELKDRHIDELSGGQQQRVALARALAPEPKVLLLDESLAALDYKLRKEMQIELKRLQHATGITFIFVTHDQEEALTMSDRIAVINEGKLLQVGTPHEIYNKPQDHFVASFVGDTNFLEISSASKSNNNDEVIFLNFNHDQILKVPCKKDMALNKSISIAIRPEKVSLVKDADSALLAGEIVDVSFFGTDTHYSIELDSSSGKAQSFHVRMQNASNQSKQYVAGERVGVIFNAEDIQVIDDSR